MERTGIDKEHKILRPIFMNADLDQRLYNLSSQKSRHKNDVLVEIIDKFLSNIWRKDSITLTRYRDENTVLRTIELTKDMDERLTETASKFDCEKRDIVMVALTDSLTPKR